MQIVRTQKGRGEGSSQMLTIAYKRRRGGVKVAYVRKKNFFGQKKLLHSHLLLSIEKCKPALSYK